MGHPVYGQLDFRSLLLKLQDCKLSDEDRRRG
jgi:hypothetical protein